MPDNPPVIFDDENPEWTDENFARASYGDDIPAHIRAAFPNTRPRGRPKAAQTKITTSIRLDPEVVEAFKATGKGWQTRINEALRRYVAEHPIGGGV